MAVPNSLLPGLCLISLPVRRYEVHEKLQNFMVPVTPRGNTWHDEQIDELFASLMGKGFTTNGVHKDEPTAVDDSPIALDGLRVF